MLLSVAYCFLQWYAASIAGIVAVIAGRSAALLDREARDFLLAFIVQSTMAAEVTVVLVSIVVSNADIDATVNSALPRLLNLFFLSTLLNGVANTVAGTAAIWPGGLLRVLMASGAFVWALSFLSRDGNPLHATVVRDSVWRDARYAGVLHTGLLGRLLRAVFVPVPPRLAGSGVIDLMIGASGENAIAAVYN
jgi:hypothetical protein